VFPDQIPGLFEGVDHVVLVGAPDPVAIFGWPGAASRMLPEHVAVVTLAHVDEKVVDALAAVADAFPKPARSATIAAFDPPPAPSGALDSYSLAAAIAATLPEHAVVAMLT
jgi:acetolactate synthase I/II/III large subunit